MTFYQFAVCVDGKMKETGNVKYSWNGRITCEPLIICEKLRSTLNVVLTPVPLENKFCSKHCNFSFFLKTDGKNGQLSFYF